MSTPPTQKQLTAWAENCLRINHLHTLLQRELVGASGERAQDLSERARRRAWDMFNEMIASGATKPDGYTEPEESPK